MGLAIFILRILPSSWARALLRFLAQAAFVLGVRRRVALDNLRLAYETGQPKPDWGGWPKRFS